MRQLKMSAGLCAFCGLLYFFARILEIYFFKHYTADLSENMTALFAAQLFRMFFVFIACFGIGKGLVYLLISAGAHIDEFFVDIVILPLSVFIAAVLPFGLEIKHHDKPLLPVEALYYEALDITAEPEIRVVGFFGVYGKYADEENKGNSDTHCRYMRGGNYIDVPAPSDFIAEKKRRKPDVTEYFEIMVYPNTGVPIEFVN